MPKKKPLTYANAASVRRRLVFDDEPADTSLTFSVGKCLSDVNDVFVRRETDKQCISEEECQEFRDLLLTNPPMPLAEDDTDRGHNNYVHLKSRHYDSSQDDESSVAFGFVVFLLCVLFVVVSFVVDIQAIFNDIHVDKDSHDVSYVIFRRRRIISLFGFVSSLCTAVVLGVCCCGFSWIIVYFDSLKPGRIPPTPLSPSKYRQTSGHTFHLSYVMAIICGVLVFMYYLWLSAESYIPH